MNKLVNIQIIIIFFITLGYHLQTNPMPPIITESNVKRYNLDIDQRIKDYEQGEICLDLGNIKLNNKYPIYENLNQHFILNVYCWDPSKKFPPRTIFEELVEQNRPDLIKKIVDYDPQAALKNKEFLDSFYNVFVFKKSVELAKVFIDAGIDLNQEFGANIPLLAEVKAIPLVKLFLIRNANPNRLIEADNDTPLSRTLGSIIPDNKHEKLQLLIIGGGDINAINSNTREQLLKIKDVRETCEKRNALFEAVQTVQDLQVLTTFEIPLKHVRNTKGNSLLYHALRNQNYTIAKRLLYLWPTLLIQPNFNGKTPFDMLPMQSATCLFTNYN